MHDFSTTTCKSLEFLAQSPIYYFGLAKGARGSEWSLQVDLISSGEPYLLDVDPPVGQIPETIPVGIIAGAVSGAIVLGTAIAMVLYIAMKRRRSSSSFM